MLALVPLHLSNCASSSVVFVGYLLYLVHLRKQTELTKVFPLVLHFLNQARWIFPSSFTYIELH